ncbi:MAG: TetR/AcrR family transcriptional regulator [Chloroflexota bacterium]
MSRKSKTDWFTAGVQLINQDGAKKLTIDALCQHIGMTKGSFYHHFKGMDNFIKAFLIYFEEEGTLQIIEQVEQEESPHAKIRLLIELSTQYPPELEVGMRAWAHQDERVQQVFERVDQQRLDYLTQLWLPLVNDEATARVRGRVLYTILIGGEHILPPLPRDELRAVFDATLNAFGVKNEHNQSEQSRMATGASHR